MTFDPTRKEIPSPTDLTPPPPPYPRTSPSRGEGDQPSLSPEQIRELFPLTPTTPRALATIRLFKEAIAQGLSDLETLGLTTEEFIDALALEIWQITRTVK